MMSHSEHPSNSVDWLVDSSDDDDETEASLSPRVSPAQVWALEEAARLSDAAAVDATLQGAIACESTIDATLLELKKTMESVTMALEPPVSIQLPPTISAKDSSETSSGLACPQEVVVKSSEVQSAAVEGNTAELLAEASNSPVSQNRPWFDVEQANATSSNNGTYSQVPHPDLIVDNAENGSTYAAAAAAATAKVAPSLPGGCHPLHYAALGGDVTVATRAIAAAVAAAAQVDAAALSNLSRVGSENRSSSGNTGVDPRADNGATPLHWAASAGHAAIVNLLLSHGANPFIRTKTGAGATPRDLASAKGHSEVVELLSAREAVLSKETSTDSANREEAGMKEKEADKAERGDEAAADAGEKAKVDLTEDEQANTMATTAGNGSSVATSVPQIQPLEADVDDAARISFEQQRKLADDDEWEESKEDRVGAQTVVSLPSRSLVTAVSNTVVTVGKKLEHQPSESLEMEAAGANQFVASGDSVAIPLAAFAVATQLAATGGGESSDNAADVCCGDEVGKTEEFSSLKATAAAVTAPRPGDEDDNDVVEKQRLREEEVPPSRGSLEAKIGSGIKHDKNSDNDNGHGRDEVVQNAKHAPSTKHHGSQMVFGGGGGSRGPSAQVLSEHRRRKAKHFLAATSTTATFARAKKKSQSDPNSSLHSITTTSSASSVIRSSIVKEVKGPSASELSRMRQSKSKALREARYAGTIEDSTSVAAATTAAPARATIAATSQPATQHLESRMHLSSTLPTSSSSSSPCRPSAAQLQSPPQATQSLQDFLHPPGNEGSERTNCWIFTKIEGKEHSIGLVPPPRIVGIDAVGAHAAYGPVSKPTATCNTLHATIQAKTRPAASSKRNLASTNARAAAAQRRANTNWTIAKENERIKARLHEVYQGQGAQYHQYRHEHELTSKDSNSNRNCRVPLVQQQAHPIFMPWTGYRTNASASGLTTTAARTATASIAGESAVSFVEPEDHGPAANAVSMLYGHKSHLTTAVPACKAAGAVDQRSGMRNGCPRVPKGLGCVLCAACGQRSLLGGRRRGLNLNDTEIDDYASGSKEDAFAWHQRGADSSDDSNADDDDVNDGGSYRPCPRCEVEWYCDETCRLVDWSLQHRRKCLGVKHHTQSLPGAPSTAVNAHTPFWVVDERFALARRLLLSKPKPTPQAILSATEALRRRNVAKNRQARSKSVWADSLRSESDFNSQEPGEVEMAATMDLLQGQSNVEWQAKFEAHLLHEAYAKKIAPVIEDKYDPLVHSVRLSERHHLEAKLATAAELEHASGAGFAAASDRHKAAAAVNTIGGGTGGGAKDGVVDGICGIHSSNARGNGSGTTSNSGALPSKSSVGYEVQPSSPSLSSSGYRLDRMWARDVAMRREKRVAWGDQSGLRSVFSDQGHDLPQQGLDYSGGVRNDISSAELPSHLFDGGVEGIKRTK